MTARAGPPKRSRRRAQEFLKGPVPLGWLAVAARLRGKALAVGIAVWFESGRKKRSVVNLTGPILARFGVSRHSAYRALEALEKAGLVRVERNNGKNSLVEIKEQP